MKKKLTIKLNKTDNSVQSSAVFTKFQDKVKKNREKFNKKLQSIRPTPNNKYGLEKYIPKNIKLVILKAFTSKNGKKVVYTLTKKETVSGNGFNVAFKEKEIESNILTRAKSTVKAHYQKRGHIYKFLFVWFNILLIAGILLQQKNSIGGVLPLSELFGGNSNLKYLLFACFAFIFIMVLETLRTNILIFRTTKRHRPFLSYKSATISIYYDLVLPIKSGKAFEVFYLNSGGVKSSIATSVPIAKYVFGKIATIITSTTVILFKWSFLAETSVFLLIAGIVMLVGNFVIICLMLLFATNNKIAPKIVYNILKLAQKLRLIKDHKELFFRFMRFVLEYQKSIQYYIKSKFIAIASVISSLLISLTKATIPFLVYCVFAQPSPQLMLDIMSKYYIVRMIAGLIPVPGGMGVSEISFASIFASYFIDGTLFWAVLIWRFFSYFLFVIQGAVVVGLGMLLKKTKNKKTVKT